MCLAARRQAKGGVEVGDDVAVTALTASEDLSQIAVGLGDGTVLLFKGEFHRDRGSFKREVLQVRARVGAYLCVFGCVLRAHVCE